MDTKYKHNYGFGKTVVGSFEAVITKVTDALQKEGFGILSDIDVAATLKKKLNLDSPLYGESGASEALKDKIQKKFGWTVTIPSYLDSEELK